jgi:hypothetical protein
MDQLRTIRTALGPRLVEQPPLLTYATITKLITTPVSQSANPSPRRRHFKSITQVKLPDNYGNLYGVFVAICEEGRAWRKDPDTDQWAEVSRLPAI